jgi:hypothetical protein
MTMDVALLVPEKDRGRLIASMRNIDAEVRAVSLERKKRLDSDYLGMKKANPEALDIAKAAYNECGDPNDLEKILPVPSKK